MQEDGQDSESKSENRRQFAYRDRLTKEFDYVPDGTAEPLKADGTKYAARYSAEGIESIAARREGNQRGKELHRQITKETQQNVAEYLHGLPEFSQTSEARIRKISSELIETITKAMGGFIGFGRW